MSRNDEYDSASMENPHEKMVALEEEIAIEDARKNEEHKYAPHDKKESDAGVKTGNSPHSTHHASKEEESTNEDEADDEIVEEEIIEEETEKTHTSSLFGNIIIVLVVFLVAGMVYMYWQQQKTMPKTPLENAMEEYTRLKERYTNEKIASFEVQKRQIMNDLYLQKLEQIASLEGGVQLKLKKVEDLKREIMGVRGEVRSYFSRYKANTRKKARNLHFESIMTTKTGQTYLDVTIQRVTDDYVSIVHAGGASRLAPDDLPESIQTRLAYGDPLGIAVMDEEIRQQQEDGAREKPSVISVAEKMETANGKMYNAPSASPVSQFHAPVSSAEIEPPSKLPSVSTKNEGASAPQRTGFDANPNPHSNSNWKPAPVPAPFPES